MLYVGSDDGAYRLPGALDATAGFVDAVSAEPVLESDAVMRLRTFDDAERPDGLFAATKSGLFHSLDGESWTDLGVPTETVYSVGTSNDGETLYAGTRPAEVYAAGIPDSDAATIDPDALDWRECEGFQDLPSREHWRLPRHEGLAQVRDVKGLPGRAGDVVAAVEVGGVHASADRGETWVERRGDVEPNALQGVERSDDWSQRPGDVHDDVHELAIVNGSTWVAATGFGLFRTRDAGQSWTRLDDDVEQKYFRTVYAHDSGAGAADGGSDPGVDGADPVVYAAGALSSSGNWDDPDENPGYFALDGDGELVELSTPRPDEVVTGIVAVDDALFAGTHRGSLLRATADGDADADSEFEFEPRSDGSGAIRTEWSVIGEFPVGPDTTGTYTPVAWLSD